MNVDKRKIRSGATWGDSETLNEVLSRLGFTTGKRINGNRAILLDKREVFQGRSGDVWSWLRNGCPVAHWFKELQP